MADIFDFAPAVLLAEVLTTTEVIGNPPNKELTIFPNPWALSSTFVSVYLFWASILSLASMHSNVSIDATIAIVNAIIQTLEFVIAEKSGITIKFLNSIKVVGTGKLTKWLFTITKLLPV